ncbi:MAG: hypothetical protein HZB16_06345 [Armatimonadetes bacterium]|nr:hypothetical protein [Armatimonadota bacterium]
MTSRERVLTACAHRQPDRVPIDLGGGSGASGIHVLAYDRLRAHLGLAHGTVRCNDLMQQLAVVEGDIYERFGLDVMAIDGTCVLRDWETYPLFDGLRVELPAGLDLQRQADGEWRFQDAAGRLYRKPTRSYYFDAADGMGWHNLSPALTDEVLEQIRERAATLYRETDLALTARFGGGFSSHHPRFLMDLVLEPARVEDELARRCDQLIAHYGRIHQAIGDFTFCAVFADDLGTQQGPMMSPDLFGCAIAPHYRRFTDWLHQHTNWQLHLHSCGAIEPLMATLADVGVDILNPIQTSAAGMDPAELKRKYGHRLTFWGGGCDTQRVLGFASPDEVADHVRERVAILAPGGGFVFNQVHVVQATVDPASIEAMLDTARASGVYPIRV